MLEIFHLSLCSNNYYCMILGKYLYHFPHVSCNNTYICLISKISLFGKKISLFGVSNNKKIKTFLQAIVKNETTGHKWGHLCKAPP